MSQFYESDGVMKGIVALLVLLLVQGCSTPSVILDVSSGKALNQDSLGQDYSVLVRLYQLTVPDYFEVADYHTLLLGDASSLEGSLLAVEEFIVEPGRDYVFQYKREEGAEYKAVAAFYRQVEGDSWRTLSPLENGVLSPMTTRTKIRLTDNRIQVIGKQ